MAYDEKLAQRVSTVLDKTPDCVEKKMFGGIGYLINGNMACGVQKDYLIVRLPENECDQALEMPHVGVFDMTGRSMKGWITVKHAGLESDQELKQWVERGIQFARTLPRK